MGFSGTLYTGDIGDIINRSKDLYEKENGKKVDGRKWINYKASPSIGVIDKKLIITILRMDGVLLNVVLNTIELIEYWMKFIKSNLALEEGDTPITKCKVHVFHPNPSSIKNSQMFLDIGKRLKK